LAALDARRSFDPKSAEAEGRFYLIHRLKARPADRGRAFDRHRSAASARSHLKIGN